MIIPELMSLLELWLIVGLHVVLGLQNLLQSKEKLA
jgi:hypothetical protein